MGPITCSYAGGWPPFHSGKSLLLMQTPSAEHRPPLVASGTWRVEGGLGGAGCLQLRAGDIALGLCCCTQPGNSRPPRPGATQRIVPRSWGLGSHQTRAGGRGELAEWRVWGGGKELGQAWGERRHGPFCGGFCGGGRAGVGLATEPRSAERETRSHRQEPGAQGGSANGSVGLRDSPDGAGLKGGG